MVAVVAGAGEHRGSSSIARDARRADQREDADHPLDEGLAASTGAGAAPGRPAVGLAQAGAPVLDMIETSERTAPGWRAAIVWAIIPPIEAPITWAGPSASSRSSPAASSAMSESDSAARAAAAAGDRRRGAGDVGRAADVAVVEADHVKAAVRERVQNSSCQAIIWVPRPITSSAGGSAGSPKVS